MTTKLISHTTGAGELAGKSPQEVISYVARVSNPHNQENFRTATGLLKYCIKHEHWSIFETASMTLEINTVPLPTRSSLNDMLTPNSSILNSLYRTCVVRIQRTGRTLSTTFRQVLSRITTAR